MSTRIDKDIGQQLGLVKMKAYDVLFIGVVSVSFAAIFIRLVEAPPLVIAAYRLSIASLILIPIASTWWFC